MGLKLQPFSFTATWVPSPQSIIRLLPLYRVIKDVSFLLGRGIIPPVPKRHTSSIIYSSFLPVTTKYTYNSIVFFSLQQFPLHIFLRRDLKSCCQPVITFFTEIKGMALTILFRKISPLYLSMENPFLDHAFFYPDLLSAAV